MDHDAHGVDAPEDVENIEAQNEEKVCALLLSA